jgi:alpha-methylacyl-CoA racemase
MFLIMGVLAALVERQTSGKGQVVDTAMTDGSAALMTIFYGIKHIGFWRDERGVNMLDSGAHFYDVYETKDGKYVSVGSIEPQFYQLLLKHTGLAGTELPAQFDRDQWPAMKEKVAAIFRQTRDEWCAIMENTDVCFAPVLSMSEAPHHPHNQARGTFTEVKGVVQPAPAPRFSRTPGAIQRPPAHPGQHTDEALADWGFSKAELAALREKHAIA